MTELAALGEQLFPQTTWTRQQNWWFAFWLNSISTYVKRGELDYSIRAQANAIGYASR